MLPWQNLGLPFDVLTGNKIRLVLSWVTPDTLIVSKCGYIWHSFVVWLQMAECKLYRIVRCILCNATSSTANADRVRMLWGRIRRWRISHGNELKPALRGSSAEERKSVFCFAPAGHGEYLASAATHHFHFNLENHVCVCVPACSLNTHG